MGAPGPPSHIVRPCSWRLIVTFQVAILFSYLTNFFADFSVNTLIDL